jgi:hypothetical protein
VSLQFVSFPPGTKINGLQTDPAWGFMSVLVIQDTGDPGRVLATSTITDFCAPNHGVTTLYGISRDNGATAANEGGHKYVTFPAPGPTGSIILPSSEADADDDQLENTLDTCPFEGNNDGWNPRSESHTGDNDEDGIPNICDPSPDSANSDQDGDGFVNRGDNCPLISNENQSDLDRDDLGDVCEVAAGPPHDPGVPGATVPAIIQWGAVFTAPFQGDTAIDVALSVAHERPPPLGALRPDAPAGLDAVVQRCLEKGREDRYPSATALRRALAPYVPRSSRWSTASPTTTRLATRDGELSE